MRNRSKSVRIRLEFVLHNVFFFHASKNITIRGIRVIDAPCWTLTFSECENVKLLGRQSIPKFVPVIGGVTVSRFL